MLRSAFVAVLALLGGLCVSMGDAQAALPTVKLLEAPLVSPAQIGALYGSATTHTAGPAAWTTAAPDVAATARALGATRIGAANGGVTADQYAANVADYIRANIATEFRFGLGKGGHGALVDQSGTAFDQADLMVQLLREGGLASSYEFGAITLTAQQFGLWSGLVKGLDPVAQTFTVDAKAACQYLANGGIPATVNNLGDCAQVSGDLSTVILAHIWVQTNGKLYDPAYKQHTLSNPVNLGALAGCTGSAVASCGTTIAGAAMTGALSGAAATGVSYIQSVNAAGVSSNMDTLAQNVEAGLRLPANAGKSYREVIGEKAIDVTYAPAIGTVLPYASTSLYSWPCAVGTPVCGVPDQYRSKVTIGAYTEDSTYFADELAGRHVRLYVSLSADDITLKSYACRTCGVFETKKVEHVTDSVTYSTTFYSIYLHLAVDHPYAALSGQYGDEDDNLIVYDNQSATAIIVAMGDASPSTQGFYNDLEAQYNSQFYGTTTGVGISPVGREGQILVQQAQVEHAVGGVFSTPVTRHHILGAINVGTINAVNAVSMVSATSDLTARAASFQTVELLNSVFEGTLDNTALRDSAPSLFATANEKSARFLSFAHGSYANAAGLLTNYDAGNKSRIQAAAAEGYDFIIPQNAMPGCFAMQANADLPSVSGTVCPLISAVPSLAYQDGRVSYLTDNQVKAQGVSQPGIAPTVAAADYSLKQKKYLDVDLARGALNLRPPADIVSGFGDFPQSLPFKRTYDSSAETRENLSNPPQGANVHSYSTLATQFVNSSEYESAATGPYLGAGWTHDYLISAAIGPGAGGAFGQDSPLQASTVLAGAAAIQGLYQSTTFDRRLSAMFVADWVADHLIDNTVSLTIGPKTLAFTRLPSGLYLPQTGAEGQMSVTGTRILRMASASGGFKKYLYRYLQIDYTDPSGAKLTLTRPAPFTTNNFPRTLGNAVRASKWTFPAGIVVSFAYNDQNLTSVSNNLGRSLTFTTQGPISGYMYEDPVLTKVTDETGRSASYSLTDCPVRRLLACNTFTVKLPDNTTLEKYSYAAGSDSPDPAQLVRSNYRLRRWYVPSDQANPFQVVVYDSLFRVASLTDPLSHKTQYFPSSVGNDYLKTTEKLNPDFSREVYRFDQFNSLTQSMDALGRSTRKAYDASRRVTLVTFPESNSITYGYDVRSNAISQVQHAKPGSGLADITTSTTYGEVGAIVCVHPLTCNRPVTELDARNGETKYSWDDDTGNLKQILRPIVQAPDVRPQVDFTYGSFAGTGGGTLSLLTSKVEKIDGSHSRTTLYDYDLANRFALKSMTADSGGLSLRTCFQFDAVGNLMGQTDPRAGACP